MKMLYKYPQKAYPNEDLVHTNKKRSRSEAEYELLDYWRDLILFHEYFHAENGAGLGASDQTGWTGLTAYLMKMSAMITPQAALSTESAYAAIKVEPQQPTST